MALNILILSGTSEANQIALKLAGDPCFAVTLSLAGRTLSPNLPPVAIRIGGFGGAAGLADYLRTHNVGLLIDATHPFAERISANATIAAETAGVALIALERPAWQPLPGDRWTRVRSLEAAATALPDIPARVFLTVGRQSLTPFAAKPQHHYVIRVIDPPDIPPAMRDVEIIVGRGPFALEQELATLRQHQIDWLVSKNSGGKAASAKLAAARALELPVIMVERPARERIGTVATVDAVLRAVTRVHDGLEKRAV